MQPAPIVFKIASEAWEFEQIHRLNYETFVEEIPQHPPNPQRLLRDRFHEDNTYLIAIKNQNLLGMVAIRDKRPFSLDAKFPNLDRYLPEANHPCEIRLLAVSRAARHGVVFRGLLTLLFNYCLHKSYDLAIISGTPRQRKLYRHLGFVPFGLPVGSPSAPYQPMYLTHSVAADSISKLITHPHSDLNKSL